MKIVTAITKRKHVTCDAIIALILPLGGGDTLSAVLEKILVAIRSNEVLKKQWFLLTLALLLGSGFGFLVRHFLGIVAYPSSPSAHQGVSKTVTITQFTCGISNYDADIGQFCTVDRISLAHEPISMNCLATATFSSPAFTLTEPCDPNGSLIGNPFYVAWKNGYLELLVEDGIYTFTPPRVVTYSAVT